MDETNGSTEAEVPGEFYQRLDKNTCLHRQVNSADYHVFDDKRRKS